MRILLDECVPVRLASAFADQEVQSVSQIGWRSSKDRPLLEFAQDSFDVFVTVDRQLEKQNDLRKLKLGFVIARVPNNRLDGFLPILVELNDAVRKVRSGEVIYVTSPQFGSR